MKLVEMQVKDYLDLTGSDAPAPGGGSASALCGAQGAALVAMVARLTLGKEKFAAHHAICNQVASAAAGLQDRLCQQVDLDTLAFSRIADAFKLPKETEEEKTVRKAAIADATLYATQVPFQTMELAMEGLEWAKKLNGSFNPNCASDLGCAALQLLACIKGAWMNVVINIGGVKDQQEAEAIQTRGEGILVRAQAIHDRLCEEILAQCKG